MYDLDKIRHHFTNIGLVVTEETDSDGMEGIRVRGQRRGRYTDKFIPFTDIDKYLEHARLAYGTYR
jgi:hypothetical protein